MPPPRLPYSIGDTAKVAAQDNREQAMLDEMRSKSASRSAASDRRTSELQGVTDRLDELSKQPGTKVPAPGESKIQLPKDDPGEPLAYAGNEEGTGGPLTSGIEAILRALGKTKGSADELIEAVRGTDPEAAKSLDKARASEAFRDHDVVTAEQLDSYTASALGPPSNPLSPEAGRGADDPFGDKAWAASKRQTTAAAGAKDAQAARSLDDPLEAERAVNRRALVDRGFDPDRFKSVGSDGMTAEQAAGTAIRKWDGDVESAIKDLEGYVRYTPVPGWVKKPYNEAIRLLKEAPQPPKPTGGADTPKPPGAGAGPGAAGLVLVGGLYLTPEEAEAQEQGENSPVVKAGIEDAERRRLMEVLNGINTEDANTEAGASKDAKPKAGEDNLQEVEPGTWMQKQKDVLGPGLTRERQQKGNSMDLLLAPLRGGRNAAVNAPENAALTANDIATSLMTNNVADPEDPFTKLFAKMTGNEAGLEANRQEIARWKKNHAQVETEILKAGTALDEFAKDKTKFLGESNTIAEHLVEGLSQFMAGFFISKKIGGAGPQKSIAGLMKEGVVHGTVAENSVNDPMQQSLIGTVTEFFPEAKGPLTDFFTVKPDDQAAVARLKRSLEGAGLGVLLDSMILPIAKAVRAKTTADGSAAELVRALPPEDRQRAFEQAVQQQKIQKVGQDLGQLGDPTGPAVSFEPKVQAAGKQLDDAGVTPETMQPGPDAPAGPMINFARIDAPEDIDTIIGDMAKTMGGEIDEARRGVQSFEQTQLAADEVDAWSTLSNRRPGEPLNAEQSVAVRELWVASGRKLREVSQSAAADPSPGNIAAARRMLAIYQAVQSEVISARTETARALSSWRIPVSGGNAGDLSALDDMIGRSGGETANAEFFKRLATADAKTMSAVAERGVFARTADALYAAWINGLLSGPKSHVTNALSGFQMLLGGPLDRAMAGAWRHMLGGGEGVQIREAVSMYAALPDGFREAWIYAGRAAKLQGEQIGARFDNATLNATTDPVERAAMSQKINAREAEIARLQDEKRQSNPAAFSSGGKFSTDRADALSARAWNVNPASAAGIGMDALFWSLKWPGKAMQFTDELFKVLNYRVEVNAQALRRSREAIEQGATPDQAQRIAAEIRANPPEDIRIQGADYAMYQTFTQPPTEAVKAFQRFAGKIPILRIIAPFVNTPANIFRFSLERTPVAFLMKHMQEDFKAGGVRRQMALGRATLGNMVFLSFLGITATDGWSGPGPSNKAERDTLSRQGWKPFARKVADGQWVQYSRADPIGFHIGMAASINEMLRALADEDDATVDADIGEIMAVSIGSIMQNVLAKSFMSGTSDFFEWANDPGRYGERYVQGLAASTVPAWMGEMRRQMDPQQREVASFVDAFRNRIAGLSNTLPPRIDMWGRTLGYASDLGVAYDTFSPLYVSKEKPEPVDVEMQRLGLYVSPPDKTLNYGEGVDIKLKNRPKAWARYLQLSGNELKLPQYMNMGAKDFINATIEGKSYYSPVYKLYGPERRQRWIQSIVTKYRDEAKEQLLDEFPEIAANVQERKSKKQASDMDMLQQGLIP